MNDLILPTIIIMVSVAFLLALGYLGALLGAYVRKEIEENYK